jgi:hypothetical protein
MLDQATMLMINSDRRQKLETQEHTDRYTDNSVMLDAPNKPLVTREKATSIPAAPAPASPTPESSSPPPTPPNTTWPWWAWVALIALVLGVVTNLSNN